MQSYKLEDPSLIPSTYGKSQTQQFTPLASGGDGRSLPNSLAESASSWGSEIASQNIKWREIEEDTWHAHTMLRSHLLGEG